MSRLTEYASWTGIVFDEVDDLINDLSTGGGGSTIVSEDPNVYIYTDTNGDVVAVNRASGQEVWRVSKTAKEGGTAAKPQGALTTAELQGLNAKISGGTATVTNEDGSVDRYVQNPDKTWDYRSTSAGTGGQSIRSEAVSRIAGQKPSGQIQPPAPGAATPAGQTPISIAQFLAAADQPGVQAGELLGEIPSGLLGTTPSGQAIPDLPITAGGILAPQGVPAGLTPFESHLGTPSPLFTGAVGDTTLGTSFNPEALASSGGQMPSADINPIAQVLQVLRERARLLADPNTAGMADELKTTPEAAAQRILDYTTNPAFYFMNPARPQTNLAPYFDAAQGRWVQPTPGGAIAAPTSSFNSSRSSSGVSVRPIGKGGSDLAEAEELQIAGDFFNSLPVAEQAALEASRPPQPNQLGSIPLDQPTTALVTQPTSFTAGVAGPEVVQASGPLGGGMGSNVGSQMQRILGGGGIDFNLLTMIAKARRRSSGMGMAA